MLKMTDLITQSVEELKTHQRDLSKEIYDLRCELKMARKLEKPHRVREKKRDRARVLTVIRQKEA